MKVIISAGGTNMIYLLLESRCMVLIEKIF